MEAGDLILVRNRKKIRYGIVGDYRYVPRLDNTIDGFCHQRSVRWIETNESLHLFNEAVHTTVRSPGIVTGSRYNPSELGLNLLEV